MRIGPKAADAFESAPIREGVDTVGKMLFGSMKKDWSKDLDDSKESPAFTVHFSHDGESLIADFKFRCDCEVKSLYPIEQLKTRSDGYIDALLAQMCMRAIATVSDRHGSRAMVDCMLTFATQLLPMREIFAAECSSILGRTVTFRPITPFSFNG